LTLHGLETIVGLASDSAAGKAGKSQKKKSKAAAKNHSAAPVHQVAAKITRMR
jgi:hypothetical protein